MSGYERRQGSPETTATTTTSAGQASTSGNSTGQMSNQDVVLYLALNNTTHKSDEIPEAMSALKQAEAEGLGHRELLPISEPYGAKQRDGSVSYDDDTYGYSMGEEGADRITWWHGQEGMESGQVKVGGELLSLGTDDIDVNDVLVRVLSTVPAASVAPRSRPT